MVDFSKLAAAAKATHDQKEADAAAERDAIAEARRKALEIGETALREHVLPILHRAARELQSQGVEMQISEHFETYHHNEAVAPRVTALLLGPRRRDGFRFQTPKVGFGTAGKRLDLFVAANNYWALSERPSSFFDLSQSESAIATAVEKLLESYYSTMTNEPHTWKD